jgi:hypothetical protein
MFIPDPGSEFSIQDQGSKRFRIWIRIIEVFLTQKTVSKLSEKINPGFSFWIRILFLSYTGSKGKKAPDHNYHTYSEQNYKKLLF